MGGASEGFTSGASACWGAHRRASESARLRKGGGGRELRIGAGRGVIFGVTAPSRSGVCGVSPCACASVGGTDGGRNGGGAEGPERTSPAAPARARPITVAWLGPPARMRRRPPRSASRCRRPCSPPFHGRKGPCPAMSPKEREAGWLRPSRVCWLVVLVFVVFVIPARVIRGKRRGERGSLGSLRCPVICVGRGRRMRNGRGRRSEIGETPEGRRLRQGRLQAIGRRGCLDHRRPRFHRRTALKRAT